jgi:hypothetical protein
MLAARFLKMYVSGSRKNSLISARAKVLRLFLVDEKFTSGQKVITHQSV